MIALAAVISVSGCADQNRLQVGALGMQPSLRGSIQPGMPPAGAYEPPASLPGSATALPTTLHNVMAEEHAQIGCLPDELKGALKRVAAAYGRITVSSTHRSRPHNRRIGGARHSMHLACRAVDFRVHHPHRGLLSFLRRQPGLGGIKRYRSGFYHIDNGERRSW